MNQPSQLRQFLRTSGMGRWGMAVSLLLVALAAQAMGMLNACDKFGVPAMASTFFNIGSVVFGLALGFVLNGTFYRAKAIHVLDFGLDAKFLLSSRTHRDVRVTTQTTLFQASG